MTRSIRKDERSVHGRVVLHRWMVIARKLEICRGRSADGCYRVVPEDGGNRLSRRLSIESHLHNQVCHLFSVGQGRSRCLCLRPFVSLLAVLCIIINTFAGLQQAEAPTGPMTQGTSLFSSRLGYMQKSTFNSVY